MLLYANAPWGYDAHFVRTLLWEAQDGVCACCDRLLMPHKRYPRCGDRDTIDHVWPQGFGGPDALGNLVLLTFLCNNRKGGRWPNRREVQTLAIVNDLLGWPTPRLPYIPGG